MKLTFILNRASNFLCICSFIHSFKKQFAITCYVAATMIVVKDSEMYISTKKHKTLWFLRYTNEKFLNKIDDTLRQTHILRLLKYTIFLACQNCKFYSEMVLCLMALFLPSISLAMMNTQEDFHSTSSIDTCSYIKSCHRQLCTLLYLQQWEI